VSRPAPASYRQVAENAIGSLDADEQRVLRGLLERICVVAADPTPAG
jgi:hypothetical protein